VSILHYANFHLYSGGADICICLYGVIIVTDRVVTVWVQMPRVKIISIRLSIFPLKKSSEFELHESIKSNEKSKVVRRTPFLLDRYLS